MRSRVLVASSYPLVIEGIKAMLEECNDISVVHDTTSPEDVIVKLAELSPEIAILDVKLYDNDDFDMGKAFESGNSTTKFLLISSFDDKDHFDQAIEMGAHALLLKSITKDELVAAVRAAVANEIYVQPKLATAIFAPKRMAGRGAKVLPPRQRQILEFMADGLSNKEIASRLDLSTETINTHVKQILKKLQAKGRAQAVAIALRGSLIS